MKTRIFILWWGIPRENTQNPKCITWIRKILEEQEVDIYAERKKWWKDNLQENLWEDYEVIRISLPKTLWCDYHEWKIIFEKYQKYFQANSLFIWHSLWGIFLLKYFSDFPENNNAFSFFLVWTPLTSSSEEVLGNFSLEEQKLQFFPNQEKIFFYHSKDDEVVEFSDFEEYKKVFPQAHFRAFENYGHFFNTVENFRACEEDIKSLKK